jgi:type VI protein secretion system component VasF
MSDNVVKFRRPEKKPDPKQQRPRDPMPRWVPFAGLLALAMVIFFVQQGTLPG